MGVGGVGWTVELKLNRIKKEKVGFQRGGGLWPPLTPPPPLDPPQRLTLGQWKMVLRFRIKIGLLPCLSIRKDRNTIRKLRQTYFYWRRYNFLLRDFTSLKVLQRPSWWTCITTLRWSKPNIIFLLHVYYFVTQHQAYCTSHCVRIRIIFFYIYIKNISTCERTTQTATHMCLKRCLDQISKWHIWLYVFLLKVGSPFDCISFKCLLIHPNW